MMIESVAPRRLYAIVVSREGAMPVIHILEGPMTGQLFEFNQEVVFVGRSSKNDLQIKDATISRKQFKVFRIGERLFVEDLKSTNGTTINGRFILAGEGYEVEEEDVVSAGTTVVRITSVSQSPLSKISRVGKTDMNDERRSLSINGADLIQAVAEVLKSQYQISGICHALMECIAKTLPRIDRIAVLLFDEERQKTSEVISRCQEGLASRSPHYSPPLVADVAESGKTISMLDVAEDKMSAILEDADTVPIKSVLCVPMISSGKTLGAIYVDALRTSNGFRKEDILLLESLSGPTAAAIENTLSHA
jgi:pSer/pThr/pTyr-binding forkhead associated (FHA) protein